jgi:pimeloyl-ACP methyl ester carboxylesterase
MAIFPSNARPAPPWAAGRADEEYGAPADPDWREIDWREHLRQVEIDGRRVNYADIGSGSGAPVVFVHGLGGRWQNWLENMPRAARERRVLAIDLPGFGASEMPNGEISIAGYGRCVAQFCEALELGPVALVGNSMGGFISAEVAISYPERTDRLVLVSAAGISITHLRRRPALTAMRVVAAVGSRTAARSRDVVVRPRLRHFALQTIVRHPTRLRADTTLELVQSAGRPGFVPAMEALLDYDFKDRIPEIGCPTLIVWGGEDVLVPVRDADEFERLIPHARKVIMEDTGHVPMVERPRTFNDRLMEFLGERGEAREGPSDEEPTLSDPEDEPAAA